MRFDLFNKRYKECVTNNGTLITKRPSVSSQMFSILSSNAFKRGDIGKFKIRCIDPKNDSIGITANKDIILDEYVNRYHTIKIKGDHRPPHYYYRTNGYLNKTGGRTVHQKETVPKVITDDVITVRVDCVEWKVSFFKNDEIIGGDQFTISITADQVYYPFIGFSAASKETQFELLVS